VIVRNKFARWRPPFPSMLCGSSSS
jgi:hypothetical protein